MLVSRCSNNSPRWTPGERLEHLFESQCDRLAASGKSAHLAAETEAFGYTFRALDDWANQLARHLVALGVQPGDRVGLMFDKGVEAYVAMLSVLKAHAAYVPLDCGYPAERLQFIAEDANITSFLSMGAFRERIAHLGVHKVFLDDDGPAIISRSRNRLSVSEVSAAPDDLCYVIYTSGTTGKPKGVAIDHASICNFVRVANEVYNYVESDRVYQGMTIAFDFSVEELWVPLLAGATLIPAPAGMNLVGDDLASYLKLRRVSAFCCVPTLLATIAEDLPDVRFILVSGEACPQSLVERWCRPHRRMLNAYGPTETTVTATVTELKIGKPVTIGEPLPTYTIVILDPERDVPVVEGELGEIAVGGIGLAREYLNRPDLTAKKFVADHLSISNNPSARLYRTGDLGRITPGGEVEFHGRIDTQVKIRGYRIELAEIEALIETLPEVSQAVVHPYAADDDSPDLVAYFTTKPGYDEPSVEAIIGMLRQSLPRYMVPSFVEPLAAIPMTNSHKVDRKALPKPSRPRVTASASNLELPDSPLEKLVAKVLCDNLNVERISLHDDFFYDLGAHSLLMARFCADLRHELSLPSISMRDVYNHRTLLQLCKRIEALQTDHIAEVDQPEVHTPSRLAYLGCGTAQVLTYAALAITGVLILQFAYRFTLEPEYGLAETYLRLLAVTGATFVFASVLPISIKWLLIGKWKPVAIPLWSASYFRLWFVNMFVGSAPPVAFAGTPIYNIYLRLLGARVGTNTVIRAKSLPVCTDLLSIGSDTIVRAKSALQTHTVQGNRIHLGPITLGNGVVIGEGSMVCPHTSIGDGGQLGHASSLQSGQNIPPGKRYHGSPAQETSIDYSGVESKPCSWLRRTLYSAFLLGSGLLGVPFGILFFYYFFLLLQWYATDIAPRGALDLSQVPWLARDMAVIVSVTLLSGLIVGLVMSFVMPRLLNKFLRTDRTYVMFGFHHIVQSIIAGIAAAPFFNLLFGDSSAIVYYLRWAGYRLQEVIQTGANFGLDQAQDNPLLCEVGSGTMVSDGLQIVNAVSSSTSFSLKRARIGRNNYLGNYIVFPADAKTDDDCLLATKVMLPIDGKPRRGVGLLGSPSFEIPRAVERDRSFQVNQSVQQELLARKNRANAVTVGFLLLSIWIYGFFAILTAHVAFRFYSMHGIASIFAAVSFLFLFSIAYFIFIERASIGFGRLQSRTVSMYDPYFLFHERHWKFCGTPVQQLFAGTPLRNVVCRLLGVKLGKMVFNDGCQFFDKTLIKVGDYANLNAFSMFQAHSLEEGVFKSDKIEVGDRCCVGAGALIHYGVQMGNDVTVQPDAFVMKGEVLDKGTIWGGNPAKVICRIRQPEAQSLSTTPAETQACTSP